MMHVLKFERRKLSCRDAYNAYNTGDKVHYPGKSDTVYVSTIDGNVWAPDAYPQVWTLEGEE